jgi:ParB family transcriptional regulator, chromosome partitioning protein
MTEKRKVLGRGLESLLPPRRHPFMPLIPGGGTVTPADTVQEIPLDHRDANPYQTRSQLDEKALDELCASIAQLGVIEPIIVRPAANGRYQVVAGERRVKAAYMADKVKIPAVVRQMSDEQAMEMTIVENLQREDLSILDQARAYQRLAQEFGLTQESVATYMGKSRSTIANFLRLLTLPDEVQKLVEKGDLTFGHAKVLMSLETPSLMVDVARKVVSNALSVRQTETLVTNLVQPRPTAKKERIVDPNVREAEENLQRALGVRVMINDRNGKGRIVLEYSSLEDFDRIVEAVTRG